MSESTLCDDKLYPVSMVDSQLELSSQRPPPPEPTQRLELRRSVPELPIP